MKANIKILPLKTINQLQKRREKLYLKKDRTRSRKREGCNNDYVLVLEADNLQGSYKLS